MGLKIDHCKIRNEPQFAGPRRRIGQYIIQLNLLTYFRSVAWFAQTGADATVSEV